ncbi:MAG: class I SAM-dependent methyltransferase [Halococcoides sp.]
MNASDLRRQWADRTGTYSPEFYAHHGPDERSEKVRDRLDRTVGTGARVLELGCSSGRHLAHLHENGYDDLEGIELNGDCTAVMDETYPDLAATAQIHLDSIEATIEQFADDAFDAVFSVETLQHVHPDASWIFEEIARITGDVLLTVENEGQGHPDREAGQTTVDDVTLYFRDWETIFEACGLRPADRACGPRDTLRVFRSP